LLGLLFKQSAYSDIIALLEQDRIQLDDDIVSVTLVPETGRYVVLGGNRERLYSYFPGEQGTIRSLDVQTLKIENEFQLPESTQFPIQVSRLTGQVLIDTGTGNISILDSDDGRALFTLQDGAELFENLIFGIEDSLLLGRIDTAYVSYNRINDTLSPIVSSETHYFSGNAHMELSSNGKYLKISENVIRWDKGLVIDLNNGSARKFPHPFTAARMVFSPDGQKLITAGSPYEGPSHVYEFDVSTNTRRKLQFSESPYPGGGGYYGTNLPIFFAQNSRYVATAYSDEILYFDLESWELLEARGWKGDEDRIVEGFLSNDLSRITIFKQSGRVFDLVVAEGHPIHSSIRQTNLGLEIVFESRADSHYRTQWSTDFVSWELSSSGIDGTGVAIVLPYDQEANQFARIIEFNLDQFVIE
tara:strand:- start:4759 stop:6006 length:1248 start_codon:yes stop_codon:yes gene_type:complete